MESSKMFQKNETLIVHWLQIVYNSIEDLLDWIVTSAKMQFNHNGRSFSMQLKMIHYDCS